MVTAAAIAGYPIITGLKLFRFSMKLTNCLSEVPLGFQPDSVVATPANPIRSNAPGVPFGLSFTGTAFSEYKLISYAFAYEQATLNRLKRLAFEAAIPRTQLKDVIGK